jgi:hypothetical protein
MSAMNVRYMCLESDTLSSLRYRSAADSVHPPPWSWLSPPEEELAALAGVDLGLDGAVATFFIIAGHEQKIGCS